ncbi:trehalose-6-phosphate synthase [Puniceibacterium sp. HSS470]|jgi:trehalose 6-phosphate synthase|nr:trehalose-6-phosphate synthase [Puniceibacterium sp. HSS470]|tara:strand:- start:63776 stop:65170 length:1395 start_codon:yes stop_codon:yes gene_type:complete
MTGRLIVVSNRIPTQAVASGGLVVALHDALSKTGGVWIGANSDPVETQTDTLTEIGATPYQRLAFDLTEDEYENYYLGFSNSVLWPICHRRDDLVQLSADFERAYHGLNTRLARMIADILHPDDVVWVQDYHFFPLAQALRKLGVRNRIGFFLHIPFPSIGDLAALPHPEDFAAWLASYTLVGLQTQGDTARCLEMYRADNRAEFLPNGAIKFGDQIVGIGSFPIGIDTEGFAATAAQVTEDPFAGEAPREYIIGVDRLDYSKGLPNRMLAFGEYLKNRKDRSRRPCLIQIAPPTREEVEAYRQITMELEEISGHVNGAHADLGWTPIRYIHRSVDRHRLAPLLRRARVGLVTPFADGMNLVAKEYVAAQDPADPGVLVLSRLAGAAEEMVDAVQINPYDVSEIARGIETALDMPLEERQQRHAALMETVRNSDVATWSRNFLQALDTIPTTLSSDHYWQERAG